MSRWEPNARQRLAEAALELYGERGYEQTTVAEIAGRAGLTERTYFRHYADKREVLFNGSDVLRELFVTAAVEAPDSATPVDVMTAGLDAVAEVFGVERREHSRQRQAVIAAHTSLRERELIKLSSLADALAGALRERGVREPAASLTAEAGVAVFKVAYERWIAPGEQRTMAELTHESLTELKSLPRLASLGELKSAGELKSPGGIEPPGGRKSRIGG